jgi:3-oxoacyl-[acyl-carrier protein] reductase
MNQYDFAGRSVAITGGAQGIGFAAAQRLVASGARVALWDQHEGALAEAGAALGSAAHAWHLDVTRADDVARVVKATAEALGAIDALICSAGITGPTVPLADYPVEAWKHVFDVNVHGVFLCNRAVVPLMRERNYGRIVNIASVAGKEGNPNASAYSASKAAVIGLTKSLGKELANTNIRVNCVTPAAVRTGIFDQMPQQHIDFMLTKIPVGRFGTADEIASLLCWLASEECTFSTGAVFDLSGGRATY